MLKGKRGWTSVVIGVFLISAIVNLLLGDESFDLVYGVIILFLTVNFKDIDKRDCAILVGVIIWMIMDFICIFKDIVQLVNIWSLIVSAGALCLYLIKTRPDSKVKTS